MRDGRWSHGIRGRSVAPVPALLSAADAAHRTASDRALLAERVSGLSEADLVAPCRVAGGPLGDSCESLRDLVAHVTMWDEISLAVLAEAGRGRQHWSLDARWETPAAGRALNAGGVAAGRAIPVDLLVHRFDTVRRALVEELRGYVDGGWDSVGPLAQHAMTVPGAASYWHAAIHLGVVPR
jgi:hypothetical protein